MNSEAGTTARWEAVSARFLEALELAPAAQADFVAALALQDAAVGGEVASLLAAHASGGDLLETPHAESLIDDLLAPLDELAPGASIDGFEIIRTLGQGSFASVYLARDLALGRLVALKVSMIRGQEARTMASLEHDHIVTVFSERIDHPRGVRLICMQYVAGTSLSRLMDALPRQSGSLLTGADVMRALDSLCIDPPAYDAAMARTRLRLEQSTFVETVAWLGAHIAKALAHAHQAGVLHLDVKPDNILLNQYARPLLADFNIAVMAAPAHGEPESAADSGMLGGTFSYMAPEHRQAYKDGTIDAFRAMTPAADLYALGIVLHQLLTAKHPKARDVEALDATASLPEAKELRQLLAPCWREAAAERDQRAAEVAARLDGFLTLLAARRALPPLGAIARLSLRSVALGLVVFVTGPQAIGSLVNISYNATRIVAHLTDVQREVFATTLWIVNPLLYGAGIAALAAAVLPLSRFMRTRQSGSGDLLDAARRSSLRRRALALPAAVAAVVTAGWGTCVVVFPLSIHLFGAPLSRSEILHFGISFCLSWIVALTYSFLYAQYLAVRVLYPVLLLGEADPRAIASRDLRAVPRRLQLYQALAGLIPLAAAALLLSSGSLVAADEFSAYRWLLVGLIGSGAAGFVVALRASSVLERSVAALTQAGADG